MDYEKLYKQSLKRGKIFRDHLLETGDNGIAGEIEYIFPELTENERIKNVFIGFVESYLFWEKDGLTKEEALAWLEKQGNNTPTIIWHNIDEKPEEMKELFCEWESDDATWHDVAFYDEESHTFRHAKMPINVTKWVYVDELLEKQGEQKPVIDFKAKNWYVSKVDGKIHDMTYNPTDKAEPKFKVGDYIVSDYCMGRIVEITNDAYLLDAGQGISFSCEDKVHLWTIADAKEGNILAGKIDGDNYILIFKTIKDGWIETYGHYYNAVNRFCVPSQLFCRDYQGTFTPATKSQRDTLMKAITDAGYEWDAEKKELKKIGEDDLTEFENALANICRGWIGEELGWKQYIKDNADVLLKNAIKKFNSIQDAPFEQKPAWSEEDEKIRNALIKGVECCKASGWTNFGNNVDIDVVLAWLEKQGELTQSVTKISDQDAWSKEDEIEIPFGVKDSELQEATYYIPKGFHAEIDDGKVVIKKGEKSDEWSEEDEKMYKIALSCIETLEDISNGKNMHADVKEWLKSIKDRATWKPSEEQIHAFIQVYVWYSNNFTPSAALTSLYNDLKKL